MGMFTVLAPDGIDVRAIDEGVGRTILIVHGGMGDSSAWRKVAPLLTRRFRVVRLHRRQYRVDLTPATPVTMAQEVQDVLAVVAKIDEPVLLVGHSSGAVLALEAVLAKPDAFAGLVAYEPPTVIDEPLGGAALVRARAAQNAGKPGTAFRIFLRDIVGESRWLTWIAPLATSAVPTLRARMPRQLDDNDAIDALGIRLDAYATIQTRTVLLGGTRSPAHLGTRLDALLSTLPNARKVLLAGQGHTANDSAPGQVARVIAALAAEVFG
jgi:pimeloyl-ACP methyl ester carboxylesterase